MARDRRHLRPVASEQIPDDMDTMRQIVGRLLHDDGVVSPEETARRLRVILVAAHHPELKPWTPHELETWDSLVRIKSEDVQAVLDGQPPPFSTGRFDVCRNICLLLGHGLAGLSRRD